MENMITTPCCECGKEMKGRIENYRYSECGLGSVVLKNILVFHCSSCGGAMPQLTAAKDLHKLIALRLLRKKSLLNGEEVRFLRKFSRFSQIELANSLGAHKTQVSQWETGLKKLTNRTDRLVRLTFLMRMTSEALSTAPNDHLSSEALVDIQQMLDQVQGNLQDKKLMEGETNQQYVIDPATLGSLVDRSVETSRLVH